MAGLKRKDAPTAKSTGGNIHKKSKKEVPPFKKSQASVQVLETETDSDPVVESDTTEHSGDNDGVSWPSDDDQATNEDSVDGERDPAGKVGKTLDEKAAPSRQPGSGSGGNNGSSSKEAHAKQKAVAQERKAAKPNADSIARSKKIWERLRRKSHVPLAERKELVAELFEIVTGRVKDFVFKHDSVRVIQTALKYANIDQRKMIASELKGEYRGLAESRYAKFLIGKLLVHGDTEVRDMVVPELYGHVRRMIRHPEASWILDDIYRGAATPTQKANLLREWYGAEFAIFKTGGETLPSSNLKDLLAGHPEKRTPIMRSLHDLINGLVQKKTTGFTMLHDAMLEYFLNVQPDSEEAREFIELLKGDEEGDLLKNLAFTKAGARVVCLALAHGSAKDRKQILRTYKTIIQTLAYDACGHQVLLAVYDLLDDTVLTAKSVFPELTGKDPVLSEAQTQTLLASAVHLNARISFLYPFSGISKAILPEEDLTILAEIHSIRTKTSKKNPELRRNELAASLSPPLLSFIATSADSLVQSSFGCQFITETLLGGTGDKQAALAAVAALPRGSSEAQSALATPAAGRMLKTLVQGGRYNPKLHAIDPVNPPLGFHNLLYASIKDDIVEWAMGSNSFVVLGLLEADGFSKRDALTKQLRKQRARLLEAAATEPIVGGCGGAAAAAGAGAAAAGGEPGTVHGQQQKKGKGKSTVRARAGAGVAVGNRGTQLLLGKLDE